MSCALFRDSVAPWDSCGAAGLACDVTGELKSRFPELPSSPFVNKQLITARKPGGTKNAPLTCGRAGLHRERFCPVSCLVLSGLTRWLGSVKILWDSFQAKYVPAMPGFKKWDCMRLHVTWQQKTCSNSTTRNQLSTITWLVGYIISWQFHNCLSRSRNLLKCKNVLLFDAVSWSATFQ